MAVFLLSRISKSSYFWLEWLMSPDLSPCEMDPDQMDRFLSVLTSYHVKLSKQDLSLKIDRVRKLCESIYHKYSKVGGEPSTYAKTLHFMRGKRLFTEALQLEGCRALISSFIGAGGDIIRMGANAVREGQALKLVEAQQNLADSAPTLQSKKKKKKKQSYERNASKSLPMISLRFFLSDFPSDQRDVFESSLKRMFAFLMKTPESGSIPFWKEKLTPSEAVRTALQAGSLQSRKPSVSTSTASTRQLMMNGEESRNLSHISTKTHILGCCVSASGKIHRNATVIKVDRRSLEGDIEKSRRLGFKRSEFLARDAATLGRITSMTPIRGVTALSESRAGGGVYSNNQKKDGRGVVRQYSSFRSAEMRNSGKQSAYQDSIIGILSHEDNPLSINKKELRSRHVTRDRISEERRREYVGILANDAVLGPMLNLVRNILHFPLSHLSDGGTEFSLFNYTLI